MVSPPAVMSRFFTPARGLLAGLALWAVQGAIYLIAAPPLGHDESQYAVIAQDALHGLPSRWGYVSQGMVAVAGPGVAAGGSELALRVLPWLLGITFVLTVAHLAWRLFGLTTAAWSVALLATAKPLVRHSVDLLSDLPSTTLLIAATTLTLTEVTREHGPRWRFVWVAPLLAAAFYVRYASCIPIALLGAAALAMGWRAILRRPGPVVVCAALVLLLLLPHALKAMAQFGSPLGILLASQQVPQSTKSGLATYLTSNPFMFYGYLLAPVAMVGVLAIAWCRERRGLVLWALGVTHVIALGVTALGQFRYVFFGVSLLLVLGVEGLRRAVAAAPASVQLAARVVAVLAIAWAATLSLRSMSKLAERRRVAFTAALVTAEAIRHDAAGRPCRFVATHYTQLEWYSGCNGFLIPDDALAHGDRIYYVRDPHDAPVIDPPGRSVVVFGDAKLEVEVRRLLAPNEP